MSNRKTKAAKATPGSPATALSVVGNTADSKAASVAKTALRPTVQAALTAKTLLSPQFPDPDLNELVNPCYNT